MKASTSSNEGMNLTRHCIGHRHRSLAGYPGVGPTWNRDDGATKRKREPMTKHELSAASWTALAGVAVALGAVLPGIVAAGSLGFSNDAALDAGLFHCGLGGVVLGGVAVGLMIGHSAQSADYNIQAFWWINGRESRLQRLGPRLLPQK